MLPPVGKSDDALHDRQAKRAPRIERLIAKIPKDGGSRKHLPPSMQLACHLSVNGFNDVYGRMHWDRPSPTITSGCFNPSKGRFLHPSANRTISLREAALLQGFPRRYKFDPSIGTEGLALMIGNALPPPFVAAHARALRRAIKPRNSA
jgi:DNA (cytosine-5)-methyltransferase 1